MNRIASWRVDTFVRKRPRTAEVTVAVPAFFTPPCHAQVLGLDHDHHALGVEHADHGVGDLGGQPLLDQWPAGVALDQAGELRQADDAPVIVGDVRHVRLPEERRGGARTASTAGCPAP